MSAAPQQYVSLKTKDINNGEPIFRAFLTGIQFVENNGFNVKKQQRPKLNQLLTTNMYYWKARIQQYY